MSFPMEQRHCEGANRVTGARKAARKAMRTAAIIWAAGLMVTIATYAVAPDKGGTGLIMWGPGIIGGIHFFKGLEILVSLRG